MRRLRWVLIVLALVPASCRASYPTVPADPSIVAVQVLYTQAMSYAAVGSSYSFNAYAIRSDGGWLDVTSSATWFSSDAQIMRPTTAGSFAALAGGRVEVSARYQSTVGALSIPVIRPELLPYPRLSISGGDPRTIGTTVPIVLTLQQSAGSAAAVTNLATWTSANPSVVTVDGGSVNALRAGTTVITAAYSGLTIDYALSVQPIR